MSRINGTAATSHGPAVDGSHHGANVAVVGCGHVGAVTAACLAALGHQVTGIDIDPVRVATLHAGRPPFAEPGLAGLLRAHASDGRLRFTTSYEDGLAGAAFIFLCVNTPSAATGAADLRGVRDAVTAIAQALNGREALPLLVVKSTSPIGTGDTIDAILTRVFAGGSRHPGIAANPEFLREGSAVADFFHPDRIVIGADDRADGERLAALYHGIDAPVILTDLRAAEMIKYVANAFLATRVSFINEIARLCDRLGVDVDTVVGGVALDPRIGGAFFRPGIGYGGSCLPKDVAALCHTGDNAGVSMRVLAAVQETNVAQRRHAVNSIRAAVGPLEGRTIAVWGLTFKGGTEDLRESPTLDIVALLRNEGASVRAYDPSVPPERRLPQVDEVCRDPISAARDACCVAILADWPEFACVNLGDVRRVLAGNVVFDGRNMLDRTTVEAAGLMYLGVGRPRTVAPPPDSEATLVPSGHGR